MDIEIGKSTFRLMVDNKYKNVDILKSTIVYEMFIDKTKAYKTIKNYFIQNIYVFLYRSILLFILSLLSFIPIIFNINIDFFSALSILFLIPSFIYCVKFFNLWKTSKILIDMTFNFIQIEIDINKNPE